MLGHPARFGRPLVVLVLACAVLAGCGSDGGPARARESVNGVFVGRRGGRRIVIAGDSITELSRPAIVAALARRDEVRVDGYSGHTIGGVLPALAAQVATRPDVAVVNLGTNDMVKEHRAWQPDLERMLHLVADVPCAVVFTIYDGAHPPPGANIGTAINARLAAARRRARCTSSTGTRRCTGTPVSSSLTRSIPRFVASAGSPVRSATPSHPTAEPSLANATGSASRCQAVSLTVTAPSARVMVMRSEASMTCSSRPAHMPRASARSCSSSSSSWYGS